MPNQFSSLYAADPSPAARRLLWHVLSLGRVSLDEPDHHQAFDKPGAHLFWVVSGRGRMQIEQDTFRLEPGPRCWLVDLRKARTYIPRPGGKLVTAGFRFGGLGIEVWHEMLGPDKEFTFHDRRHLASIQRTQRKLLQLVRRGPAGHEWRIHELIGQTLGLLSKTRQLFPGSKALVPPPVTRVINTIQANPAHDWKAKELAAVARVSYSGLRRLFKRSQHESVHKFIQRIRLEQARMLLADYSLTVKEVAERLNFSSEYYFSHFFRNAAGVSPTEFRSATRRGR